MSKRTKDCPRASIDPTFDENMSSSHGELFAHPDGYVWGSSDISVVHSGLDIIKQLYKGLVIDHVFQDVKNSYDNNEKQFNLDGTIWSLGSGRRGGLSLFFKFS